MDSLLMKTKTKLLRLLISIFIASIMIFGLFFVSLAFGDPLPHPLIYWSIMMPIATFVLYYFMPLNLFDKNNQ